MARRKTVVLVLLGLAILGLGGWFGLQRYVAGQVRASLDDLRPGLDVTYDGLALHPLSRSLSLETVTARTSDGVVFKADRAEVYSCDTAHETPRFLRCALRGVRAEGGDWAGPAGSLLRTGTDLDLDYTYDEAGRTLTVRTLRLVQKDAFETELSGQLGNVDLDRFLDGFYFAASLARLEAVYRDRSLAGRVLEAFAAQFHTDAARIRETLSAWAADQAGRAASRGLTRAAGSLEALAAFLKKPGELSVHLAPAEPVPVLYLFAEGNLVQALDLLNARIEAH